MYRRMLRPLLTPIAPLVLLVAGCAGLKSRLADLGDAVYLHAGTGAGLEAHASLVPGAGMVGLGKHVGRRMGLDGWQRGKWKEGQGVFAFPFLAGINVVQSEPSESRWSLPAHFGCVIAAGGERFVLGPNVGAFLGVVGLEAGLDLVELVDFLCGLFGLDMLGDDRARPQYVASREWTDPFPYRLRLFVGSIRAMTDKELVAFIPRTHRTARYLVFQELSRRPIAGKVDLMLQHFEFHTFNTNEAHRAYRLLESEASALAPDDPRRKMIEQVNPAKRPLSMEPIRPPAAKRGEQQ